MHIFPALVHSHGQKFDVIQVKKNDNPFIIMTNYDQLEFFNL